MYYGVIAAFQRSVLVVCSTAPHSSACAAGLIFNDRWLVNLMKCFPRYVSVALGTGLPFHHDWTRSCVLHSAIAVGVPQRTQLPAVAFLALAEQLKTLRLFQDTLNLAMILLCSADSLYQNLSQTSCLSLVASRQCLPSHIYPLWRRQQKSASIRPLGLPLLPILSCLFAGEHSTHNGRI